jgi:hypothetical protein
MTSDPKHGPAHQDMSAWIAEYAAHFADADEITVTASANPHDPCHTDALLVQKAPSLGTCHPRTINLFIKYGGDPDPTRRRPPSVPDPPRPPSADEQLAEGGGQ